MQKQFLVIMMALAAISVQAKDGVEIRRESWGQVFDSYGNKLRHFPFSIEEQ